MGLLFVLDNIHRSLLPIGTFCFRRRLFVVVVVLIIYLLLSRVERGYFTFYDLKRLPLQSVSILHYSLLLLLSSADDPVPLFLSSGDERRSITSSSVFSSVNRSYQSLQHHNMIKNITSRVSSR